MKPNLSDKTVLRIQEMTDEPVTRGMDKAINQCLDELEQLRKGNHRVLTCNRMEELVKNDK